MNIYFKAKFIFFLLLRSIKIYLKRRLKDSSANANKIS